MATEYHGNNDADPRMVYARHYHCPDCKGSAMVAMAPNPVGSGNVAKLFVMHMSWCDVWDAIRRDFPGLANSILSSQPEIAY